VAHFSVKKPAPVWVKINRQVQETGWEQKMVRESKACEFAAFHMTGQQAAENPRSIPIAKA
jgi:hypothetical protein